MKDKLFRRRFSAVGFGFLASYLLGRGDTELFKSTCVLAIVLFLFSFDLAVEDESVKRRKKYREIRKHDINI
ncbi:hypothetical protein JKN53_000119 [Enterococcus faecalis]|jgi:hypothetical protein|uniref:hypothetical protein n=1 Tax=Enterococcus faecalis TaxID=1351 RepID=UPI00035316C9|nr:hypothetical protein [Enterococcus faecalis]DAL40906.1 MAG TPA_asm: hypothetical protein [Caudoviricetes sp.]EHA4031137.1 hypothetical protein [Enterococcus faecalis]EHY9169220.1 hypothetical protein [Enterococcus faecalis]EPI26287.1 hypothetical protein D354_00057 [Enterococcus faecalis]EPI30842.1 hypothetical protein D351_01224 [Enterococcus faecalis WKS-26-18-2]